VPIWGLVTAVVAAVVAAGLLAVFARFVPTERREPLNDVVGFVYAVVGVIYAVVLAMVVASVLSDLYDSRLNTYTESDALIDLYWYGKSLPQPAATQIDNLTRTYTETVVKQEWALLGSGQASATAWDQEVKLRDAIEAQQPQTAAAQTRYQDALRSASTVGNARRRRVNESTEGIPALLWAALIAGGVVTIGFSFLFGTHSRLAHCTVVFSLTLVVSSMLLVIFELNHPFAGAINVRPDAFQLALDQMNIIQ